MTHKLLNESILIQPRKLVLSAWHGHVPFGVWLISTLKPRTFVELGTHKGASYFAFCEAVLESRLDTKCYAVDTWKGDEHAGFYGEEIFLELVDYHDQNYGAFSRLLRMTFDEAVDYFSDKSIDLLHLDGFHTYEVVKHDFETWLPKLSARAVVLFHDINVRERGFGVWKLWEELKQLYPTIEFEHSHGLGVLFISEELLPGAQELLSSWRNDSDRLFIKRLFARLGQGIEQQYAINDFKRAIAERDGHIASLNQAVAERDARIAHSNQTVDVNDERVAVLTQAVADREAQIANLQNLIDQNEKRHSALQAYVDERETCLNRIYESHGWKALIAYYKARDKFLPLGTRRRAVAKSVWNFLRLSGSREKGDSIHAKLTQAEPLSTEEGSSPLAQRHAPIKLDPWLQRRMSSYRKNILGGNVRVLVISGDILPLEGLPTTGAGLRAWGLGEGLRSRGHDVVYAMPKDVIRQQRLNGAVPVHLFDPLTLDDVVSEVDPDVLIFQHWPWLAVLRQPPRGFVVVDFHGPLLLETHFRDPAHVKQLLPSKLVSLSRADYFICAGKRQLYYYLAWLLVAGFDLQSFPISVVPFSLSPDLPARSAEPEEPLFVYGGIFLPWQDPMVGLKILVAEMESLRRGELRFFGGKHSWLPLSYERFDGLRKELESSPRVRFQPTMSRDQLINEYTGASVAWDLMARNPEREMAFTSRTVEYLWCGLPVVYNNYADLSEYIAQYDAGWVVDPSDEQQIRETVREILTDRETVCRKGRNASRLVQERLTWDKTIEPLDRFCRNPYRAIRKEGETLVDQSVVDSFQPASVVMSPEVMYFVSRIKAMLPASSRQFLKRVLARRRASNALH